MIQLYYRSTCSYCVYVLDYLARENIPFERKELGGWHDTNREELVRIGGQGQVPFLVDPERDVAMYESRDIVDYLRENYAGRRPDEAT